MEVDPNVFVKVLEHSTHGGSMEALPLHHSVHCTMQGMRKSFVPGDQIYYINSVLGMGHKVHDDRLLQQKVKYHPNIFIFQNFLDTNETTVSFHQVAEGGTYCLTYVLLAL